VAPRTVITVVEAESTTTPTRWTFDDDEVGAVRT
jgi:hypothetical protein